MDNEIRRALTEKVSVPVEVAGKAFGLSRGLCSRQKWSDPKSENWREICNTDRAATQDANHRTGGVA